MSAIIAGTGVTLGSATETSVALAASAAKRAAEAASVSLEKVGLLLHVGVYREDNIVEPSLASLIQRELNICRDFTATGSPDRAFSCDLLNGPCGPLNALQVATATLALGDAEHALIVSANVHPSRQPVESFPVAPVGAAVLLSRGDEAGRGFRKFQSRSDWRGAPGSHCFCDLAGEGKQARSSVSTQLDDDAHARFLEVSRESVQEFMRTEGLDPDKTLLISSEPYPEFNAELVDGLDVGPQAHTTFRADPSVKSAGSSAVLAATHDALKGSIAERYEDWILLTVSSGISATCAHYRP